jgi:hypothetical protein
MAQGGSIYIEDGTYNLSNSFAGWTFLPEPNITEVIVSQNAAINVPSGYSSYIWRFLNAASATQPNSCSNNTLQGGKYQEAGANQKLWTGIQFEGTGASGATGGVLSNKVRDMFIGFGNIGIRFVDDADATTGGWINHNFFDNVLIYGMKSYFIDFDMSAVTYDSAVNGFHHNAFTNCLLQRTGPDSLYGIHNIQHKNNIFVNCYVVDFVSPQISANVATNATDTTIVGGTVCSVGFTDSGTGTSIFGDVTRKASFKQLYVPLGLDLLPTSDPNNVTFNLWNNAQSERLYLQKSVSGTVGYIFNSVRQASAGSLRPIIFQVQDVPGATTTESFRVNTDGTTKFTGKMQIMNNTTGSGSAALGSNSPATTNTAPYTWLTFTSSDGSTVYVPAFK